MVSPSDPALKTSCDDQGTLEHWQVDLDPVVVENSAPASEVIGRMMAAQRAYALTRGMSVFTYTAAAEAAAQQLDLNTTAVSHLATAITGPVEPLTSALRHQLKARAAAADSWLPVVDQRQQLMGIASPQGFRRFTPNQGCELDQPLPPTADGWPLACSDLYRSATALQAQEERLRIALEGARMGIWDWDLSSDTMIWSMGQERLFGLPSSSFEGGFEAFLSRVHPEDQGPTRQTIEVAVRACQHYHMEFRIIRPDSTVRWLSSRGKVFCHDHQPLRLAGVTLDITEHKLAEAELLRQTQRERLIGEVAQQIRQLLDLDSILDQTVTSVREFIEADRAIVIQCSSDMSGQVIKEACDPRYPSMMEWTIRDPWSADEKYLQFYRQGRGLAVEDIRLQKLQPEQLQFLEYFQVRAEVVVPLLLDNTLWGLLVMHQCERPRAWQTADVRLLQTLSTQVSIAIQQARLHRDLKEANEQLKKIAFLDGLTQVANRRRFEAYLSHEWRRLARDQMPLSLILCDIDYFKKFNDVYGHQAGDSCLRRVAGAISRSVKRPADLVARYGGEEFAVILPGTDLAGAEKVAEDMRLAVRGRRIPHGGSDVQPFVTLSLGVATCQPAAHNRSEALVRRADEALYQAKHDGRDRVVSAQ